VPLAIAIVRVDANGEAIHQRHELGESVDIDEDRRRIDIGVVLRCPHLTAVRLAECDQSFGLNQSLTADLRFDLFSRFDPFSFY
jgi:hypothetical protein